ncbi:MAG: NAD-dependent epimerase/dehydratase family protein [Ruminococcus sp.]
MSVKISRKNKSNRVVYISSSEVYGSKLKDQPYQESDYGYVDLLNPRSCYPSSKRASETLCSAYASEYGLDTVVVRPGHIYIQQLQILMIVLPHSLHVVRWKEKIL